MEEAFHGFSSSDDSAETTVVGVPCKSSHASKKQTAPMDVAVSEEEGIAREEAIYARDRAAKSIRKTAEWIANAKAITEGDIEVRRKLLEQMWGEFRQLQQMLQEESELDDEIEEYYCKAAAKLGNNGIY
uniref:Uncharacterized protein n=1 Tax=Anopheles atroparvus TaxID=41427 RepID=A0A182J129_ANOAO